MRFWAVLLNRWRRELLERHVFAVHLALSFDASRLALRAVRAGGPGGFGLHAFALHAAGSFDAVAAQTGLAHVRSRLVDAAAIRAPAHLTLIVGLAGVAGEDLFGAAVVVAEAVGAGR